MMTWLRVTWTTSSAYTTPTMSKHGKRCSNGRRYMPGERHTVSIVLVHVQHHYSAQSGPIATHESLLVSTFN